MLFLQFIIMKLSLLANDWLCVFYRTSSTALILIWCSNFFPLNRKCVYKIYNLAQFRSILLGTIYEKFWDIKQLSSEQTIIFQTYHLMCCCCFFSSFFCIRKHLNIPWVLVTLAHFFTFYRAPSNCSIQTSFKWQIVTHIFFLHCKHSSNNHCFSA